MALMIVDPCTRCHARHSESFRKICQGTPFCPGKCPSAKGHWDYIGGQSVARSINDSFTQKLRRYVQTGRRVKP